MPTPKGLTIPANEMKSPGSWFIGGQALLNGQTHPLISAAYAVLFTAQRAASYLWGDKVTSRMGKFLLGKQGSLFASGVETALVGGLTQSLHGSPQLAAACFASSATNTGQAVLYDGVAAAIHDAFAQNPETKRGKLLKDFMYAACNAGMLYSLREVAQNAGFSPEAATEMVAPGLLVSAVRVFKPNALHPDLAFVDMMGIAAATSVEAFSKGHVLNGLSRIFSIVGFSRLAVERAQRQGIHSIFEVEHWVPKALDKLGLHHAHAPQS